MVNGHIVSSRTPALRAASAEPSAVRPGGLRDSRDSFAKTSGVSRGVSVDGEHPALRGWQDKAVLPDGSPASSQPGPDTNGVRSSGANTSGVRCGNPRDTRERLERSSVWMRPGVKSSLKRLASQSGLSFSAACANALEIYARAKIHDQEETLFEPRMRTMIRREIRASDKRHLYFEMCNAVAAEQTRILTTDLYKRQLLKEGVALKEINKKLDNAYTMARNNILRKTKSPQLKNLLDAWWQTTEDLSADRQGLPDGTGGAGKPED